jgi:hypothetical protein
MYCKERVCAPSRRPKARAVVGVEYSSSEEAMVVNRTSEGDRVNEQ